MPLRLLAACAVAVAAPATISAARGEHRSLAAHSGPVTATVTWSQLGDGSTARPWIRIRRAGRLAADRPVPSSWGECRTDCVFVRHLVVRHLDRDKEPEVLVELYGEGAHCCAISEIYRYTDGTYRGRRTVWQADYALRDYDRDGVLEFNSADTRFCFGCRYPVLAEPIRIWHYRRGGFEDVTRAFRRPVSHYARLDRKEVASAVAGKDAYLGFSRRERLKFARLYLGRYVAETCLLDRCLRGWRFAAVRASAGDLGRGGSTYLERLHRYLVQLGYWR
jgi:hypothetical protein